MRLKLGSGLVWITIFTLTMLVLATARVSAAAFVVNNDGDATDAVTGNGICETVVGNGVCTLRAAVAEANALAGDDTITIAADVHLILVNGQITISSNIGITGDGADVLTLQNVAPTGATARIFEVTALNVASITGMKITGGNVGGNLGGGVLNFGSLTVTRCHITGNQAISGGGIRSEGTTVVIDSTISDNTVVGAASVGGGISAVGPSLTVTNSTISGNRALTSGLCGGGIRVSNGTALITNSTITDNEALGATSGSGVLRSTSAGAVTIQNSIVAGNRNNGTVSDVRGQSGPFTSGGNNLIGNSGSASGFTNGVNSDIVGGNGNPVLDPLLAPLGFFGGQMPTHGLLSTSPAVNAGNSGLAPAADQRGAGRIGLADVGAFELNNSSNGGTFSATLPDGLVNTVYDFTLVPEAGTTTYCISSGNLPLGMTGLSDCPPPLAGSKSKLDLVPTAAVALGGTPTQGGLFNFGVTATNGGNSNVTNYSLNVVGPSAANLAIAGRVTTIDGRGITNAIVTITDQNGIVRSTRTGTFGNFRFDEIAAGGVYVVEVHAKRFFFTPQILSPTEDVTEVTFIANP